MTETQKINAVRPFIQHDEMDESVLASLITNTLDQARAGSTRMATWLVVGNGAALTLCYQAMLAGAEQAPPMLSTVALCFVFGLILAFLSFVAFQNTLTDLLEILETMYLTKVAKRQEMTPPPPTDAKTWKRLRANQSQWSLLLMVSAVFFTIGALAPAVGVLDPDFFETLDYIFGHEQATTPAETGAPPP